jgi:hypothetical protein
MLRQPRPLFVRVFWRSDTGVSLHRANDPTLCLENIRATYGSYRHSYRSARGEVHGTARAFLVRGLQRHFPPRTLRARPDFEGRKNGKDSEAAPDIQPKYLSEATQYRMLDRSYWAWRFCPIHGSIDLGLLAVLRVVTPF